MTTSTPRVPTADEARQAARLRRTAQDNDAFQQRAELYGDLMLVAEDVMSSPDAHDIPRLKAALAALQGETAAAADLSPDERLLVRLFQDGKITFVDQDDPDNPGQTLKVVRDKRWRRQPRRNDTPVDKPADKPDADEKSKKKPADKPDADEKSKKKPADKPDAEPTQPPKGKGLFDRVKATFAS
jgi:cell division septation protein DedD